MSETGRSLPTIILAGERPGGSPLAQAFSVAASVMVPIAGQPARQQHSRSAADFIIGLVPYPLVQAA